MRILVIADSALPVPPRGYGGTERIVGYLLDELSRRGHELTLMAGAGSSSPGRLVVFDDARTRSKLRRGVAKGIFWLRLKSELPRHDVVHSVARLDYIRPALRHRIPKVLHFGNPIPTHEVSYVRRHERGRLVMVPVGVKMMEQGQDEGAWRVIHNAIPVSKFRFSLKPHDPPYVTFLGRLTRNKGVDTAIRVARACGIPIKVAGNVPQTEEDMRFFSEEVAPLLSHPSVEYMGEVDDAAKSEIVGGALALINPIRWDEPFGLTNIEALACGTPVVGFARGELPFLIDHGRTGILCPDGDEIALRDAVIAAPGLDRSVCRQDAERRFDIPVMVDRFEEVYRWVLSDSPTVPDDWQVV